MSSVIKVENLSKQYRLGEIGTGSLSHDVNRWWHRVRGKENPYLKIGESNDRSTKGESEYVWSLKDINFEIEQGDAVGIIGRNGAGKSTLLKILSRVTGPTTGSLKVKGRIASLLEVGTGFHPELSGRDNIFLNGAILGMRKHEIQRKFDEIVDFSGVERYIDTPVKRYSSGMYVRLAFAVAANLESEILIVDEVLAVGDAEFQKRCLGKMNEVSKGEGRTILFVSHNMGSITNLCNKGILLNNGSIAAKSSIKEVINEYINSSQISNVNYFVNANPKKTDVYEIEILNSDQKRINNFEYNEEVTLSFHLNIEENYKNCFLSVRIKNKADINIFTTEYCLNDYGKIKLNCKIPANSLVPGSYYPIIALHIPNQELIAFLEDKVMFNIEETGSEFHKYNGNDYGCVNIDCKWVV